MDTPQCHLPSWSLSNRSMISVNAISLIGTPIPLNNSLSSQRSIAKAAKSRTFYIREISSTKIQHLAHTKVDYLHPLWSLSIALNLSRNCFGLRNSGCSELIVNKICSNAENSILESMNPWVNNNSSRSTIPSNRVGPLFKSTDLASWSPG